MGFSVERQPIFLMISLKSQRANNFFGYAAIIPTNWTSLQNIDDGGKHRHFMAG